MLKGFVAGLVVANAFEWVAHKYLLHGVHRPGKSRFSPTQKNMQSHWAHHKQVRTEQFADECYVQGWSNWRTRNEIGSLLVVAGAASALFYPFSKGMAAAALYSAGNYYYCHRRAHLDPTWGKAKLPWHFDHHMNSNQDANWCVTKPWFDYIMGTRVVSSSDLQEANPLGLNLPHAASQWLSRSVEKIRPVKML